MLDIVEIGRSIRARRRACGLSQEGLALLAEMSTSNLRAIERGTGDLTVKTLARIQKVLNKSEKEGMEHGSAEAEDSAQWLAVCCNPGEEVPPGSGGIRHLCHTGIPVHIPGICGSGDPP